MARRFRYHNLFRRCEDHELALDLVVQNDGSYCKKAIDNLCLQADLAETLQEYIIVLCKGMTELIELGIPRSSMLNHQLLLPKLMRMGSDIIEKSPPGGDQFFIGIFIEIKLPSSWFNLKFFKLILGLLRQVINAKLKLGEKVKYKIMQLAKVRSRTLYDKFFTNKSYLNTA